MKLNKNRNLLQWGLDLVAPNRLKAMILCAIALPGLLSAQTLQHRYSFVSDASDSIGGANGSIVAAGSGTNVTINNGLVLPGGGGGGFSGYVSLPAGILTTTTNLTIECWVTENQQQQWATIWDFANDNNHNFEMCPFPQRGINNLDVAINPNNDEVDTVTSSLFPTGSQQYVTFTFNATNLVGSIYMNGTLAASHTYPDPSYIPGTIGGSSGTSVNALGNDIYNDSQFQGTIYEFRIWDGVVSQLYLDASAAAGPSVVINDLTVSSGSIAAGATLAVGGAEQGTLTVQLPQVSISANNAAVWSSSKPAVLSVSSNGWITAVGVGTATISAIVNGTTVTSAPITVTPVTLQHRYSFISDASDSIGGANGTVVPPTGAGLPATIANGLNLPGNPNTGNLDGYVSLPSGILTNTTSVTVECWVTQTSGNTWGTPWDFGTDGSHNFALIPDPGNNNHNMEVAFTPHNNEVDIQSSVSFPNNSLTYVCVTYSASTLAGNLYTNGVRVAATTFPDATYTPGTIGGATGTSQNMLGNDVYGDPQFSGTINEFRIWNGAVSPVYVAVSAAAGPGVIVTNVTPQTLTVSVNNSMLGSQTQQAVVTGNFIQANNAVLTQAVTNWVSSATSILTVDGNGVITAVNGGTATVSATVNGVTATSVAITVQATMPSIVSGPTNVSVLAGGSAVLSVQGLGGALSYQWSLNGNVIPGATNASLSLSNITVNQGGTYTVKLSNSKGDITGSAVLTVTQAVLLHRYSFVSDASDSVGGANGTIVPPTSGAAATIANGLVLPGSGGGHVSGYVALPAGILTNTASLTVECWVTQNQANNWSTVWDFGNDGQHNFEFCPAPDPGRNGGNPIVAFDPNNNERDLSAPTVFPNGTRQYVCVTFSTNNLTATFYTNGVMEASTVLPDASYIPGTIGGAAGTADNWLGDNVYGDNQFSGTIYELRIWNGAFSPLYAALDSIAGPGTVVTNLSPVSVAVSAGSSLVIGQTEQASATGTYTGVGVVSLTTQIGAWVSSNPNVLTVDSNGVITAVSDGTATISATFANITGVSSQITVAASKPVITQQPTASYDLLAGATLDANIKVIGNPPFVYFWFFNGGTQPIYVATNSSTLSLTGLAAADAGTYTVLVSNVNGTVTSSPITVTVSAPTPYEQVVLQLDPLGYWPLNETSGTVAYDVVGGNNGTYTNLVPGGNGITLGVSGPQNTFFGNNSLAAGFDGVSGIVDIPEGPFNITGAISVVAWAQLNYNPNFGGLIGHGDPSWRTSINHQGLVGAADGSAPDATEPSPSILTGDNGWHMVTYTYTGIVGAPTNGSLYIDGVVVANDDITTAPVGDNLDVWIGASPDYGTNRMLLANISNAAVFNYALTGAQVQGLFNGQYVAGAPHPTLSIARSGSNIVLTWQGGTLLQSSSVTGPWAPVNGATSPDTIPTTSGSQFYRVQAN